MHSCSSLLARLLPLLAGLGLALLVILVASAPARAGPPPGTFCAEAAASTSLSACAGPVTGPSNNIPGNDQRRIEEHLQALRCKGSNDPACVSPGGAAADEVSYAGLSIFVAGDYQHKDRTNTFKEIGYSADSVGPTIGVDYRLDESGVIGFAFDYSHMMGDFDNNYGDFTTDTFTFLFFGSYYPSDQSFIDGSIGFAPKQYDTDHADPGAGTPNAVSGNTHGFDFTADLTGGYDFSFDSFTIGPRLGVHYKHSVLNSFTETGTGVLFTYDDQVDDSFTGTVGVQASMAISTDFGVIVPQAHAEYVHEFLTNANTFSATAVGGGSFTFVDDDPDLNYFNLGAGLVFVLPDGISPFMNYTAEVANRLEETHTVTAGARFEF